MNNKALFLPTVKLQIQKRMSRLCFFSVNQLENNDTPGNKESALFCWHVTFDGICHSAKDLWNWIAMSMTFSGKKIVFWLFTIIEVESVNFDSNDIAQIISEICCGCSRRGIFNIKKRNCSSSKSRKAIQLD